MGTDVSGDEQGGSGSMDLREDLRGGSSGGYALRVVDLGNDTADWKGVGRIPQQGFLQADRKTSSESTGWWMGVSNSGGIHGGGGTKGGGDLHLPPLEHSRTFHCDQAHYGRMSGGGAEAGVKGGQAVVGAARLELE